VRQTPSKAAEPLQFQARLADVLNMEQGTHDPAALCAKQVALRLGVQPRTAARLMASGAIPAFKLSGRRWRAWPEEIAKYAERETERSRPRDETASR
jgi:excisionase family DNA binding protein